MDPEKIVALNAILEVADEAEVFIARHGVEYGDNFPGLTIPDLRELGTQIIGCATVAQAYKLLARTAVVGESSTYYDRLIAEPQHLDSYKLLDMVLRRKEQDRHIRGLDVGSGNGMCGIILSQYADTVTAVDISPEMLSGAKAHYDHLRVNSKNDGIGEMFFMVMDGAQLGFAPKSFDVIVSNGFSHYLTNTQQRIFYQTVDVLLKAGGRYYQPQWETRIETSDYRLSPRGELARLIVGAVLLLRKKEVRNPKESSGEELKQNGFVLSVFTAEGFERSSIVQAVKP